jgi:alkenylglycerophosphocholine/alkenylglycerophosphoethanolamine hydrolase
MWYVIIISVYALLAVLFYCKYRRDTAWILVSKTLASLAFVAAGLLALGENPGAAGYALWILIGLGFSVGGDIFLVYGEHPKAFMWGLSFFLLAHIAYGVIFTILSGLQVWDAVFFLLLVGIGITVRRFARIDLQKMTLPVALYLLAISYMVSQAFSICLAEGPTALAVMAGLGALLFFTSDSFLAWNKFKRPLNAYSALNLTTYYTGQLLMALSILCFR